jgi:hypothetical protein
MDSRSTSSPRRKNASRPRSASARRRSHRETPASAPESSQAWARFQTIPAEPSFEQDRLQLDRTSAARPANSMRCAVSVASRRGLPGRRRSRQPGTGAILLVRKLGEPVRERVRSSSTSNQRARAAAYASRSGPAPAYRHQPSQTGSEPPMLSCPWIARHCSPISQVRQSDGSPTPPCLPGACHFRRKRTLPSSTGPETSQALGCREAVDREEAFNSHPIRPSLTQSASAAPPKTDRIDQDRLRSQFRRHRIQSRQSELRLGTMTNDSTRASEPSATPLSFAFKTS